MTAQKDKSKPQIPNTVIILFGCVAGYFIINGYLDDTTANPKKKKPITSGVIMNEAFYLPKKYEHLKEIQRKGYEQILSQGKCAILEYSDISSSKSTKDNPVIFYTCKQNGVASNIFLKVSDIKSGIATAQEPPEKIWSFQHCIKEIKKKLNYPSSLRKAQKTTRTWNNGRRAVYVTAKAKNAFNLEVTIKAECLFIPSENKGANQFNIEVNLQEK